MTAAPCQWLRVSRQQPCPVCKKPDWCTYTSDGRAVCCMRVESGKAVRNGGWLHRIGSDSMPARAWSARATWDAASSRRGEVALFDAGTYHAGLRERGDWRDVDGLALSLGLCPYALATLHPAWDHWHDAWEFPMRDGSGKIVGIRLRANDGRKWAVKGSREGLFFDPALGRVAEVMLCEGPTDTAAAISLGFAAVGRPSCSGGVDLTRAFCFRHGVKRVIVMADHDAPHRRPDGSVWYPGRDGAQRLVTALGLPFKMVMPPAKDLRQWVSEGATVAAATAVVNNAIWRNRPWPATG
jgi:hypothetical protein